MAADGRSGAPSFVHLQALAPAGEPIEIAGAEAHYLARVVRVRAGEAIDATDGEGGLARLEVLETGEPLRARVLERTRASRAAELELWCGAPEGDRADWLVEKLAELGVARLHALDAERGRWERFEARHARWERLALAALRQSRSAFRLRLLPPLPLAQALATVPEGARRLVCRPDGAPAPPPGTFGRGVTVAVVGPSSGFSEAELKLLQERGFSGLALAAGRLRTETAALAAAALWAAHAGLADAPGARGA